MYPLEQIMISIRRKLLLTPSFSSLVGVDIGVDPLGGAYTDGWVFKASEDSYESERNPRSTGKSSVSYYWRDPWTNPNRHNTARFPLLKFFVLSDPTRPKGKPGLLARKDAEFRCDRIATAIKDCFNDVANKDHEWPNDVFVVSSVLWDDLHITDVPESDGLVVGDLSFALVI